MSYRPSLLLCKCILSQNQDSCEIHKPTQFLSTPTESSWRASEVLDHRHMTLTWLCLNTTWTHRISCPDLISVQQRATVPSSLSYSKVSRHFSDQQTSSQGFPSFSTRRDLLFILQTATAIANPPGIHPHSAASPEPAQDPSSAPANTAVLGSKCPRKGGCGVTGFVRHRTASTLSPSQHCWHVELMLNYPEWFINI